MMVGPAKVLLMDEISTGLDTATTLQIINSLRQSAHLLNGTVLVSLLQPDPETFALFDDLILLSEGQIAYQGPRDLVLTFLKPVVSSALPGRVWQISCRKYVKCSP